MAATVSLSKGVFAFRRKNAKRGKNLETESGFEPFDCWRMEAERNDLEIRRLTSKNYHNQWVSTNEIIQDLLSDIHCKVLEDLVQYLNQAGKDNNLFKLYNTNETDLVSAISKDIPAACLVTGVNMPDHDSLFSTLSKSLTENVTPYVARLKGSTCSTIKNAVYTIVNCYINDEEGSYEDSEDEEVGQSPSKRKGLKRSQCNMTVLNAWYTETVMSTNPISEESPRKKLKKNLECFSDFQSPTKRKSKRKLSQMKPLIVIIEDIEGVNPTVLQDLILICSEYRQKGLPFLFVFGVSTTPAAVHKYLSQDASTSVAMETFQAQPSSILLSQIIDKVLMSSLKFQVGGKVFKLLLDIFLFHDLSVHNFVQGLKYCMLEHYLRGTVSFLCCERKTRKKYLKNLEKTSLTSIRDLPSCVRYLESLSEPQKKELEGDDNLFKELIKTELINLEDWHTNFCLLVRVLHKLVYKLPGSPLGRQVREILSICLSQPVVDCPEFQESWKMLWYSGNQELTEKLNEVLEILEDDILNGNEFAIDLASKLTVLLYDLENIHSVIKETPAENSSPIKTINLKPSDRFHLREKLLSSVKPKTLTPFEELRSEILTSFEHLFIVHLKPPNTRPFHEVFFFDSIGSVKYQLLGSVRATITTGLTNPHKYLQCSCCHLEDASSLSTALPDLSLCYKLHLECGRLINLYDWMQAFVSVLQGTDERNDQPLLKKGTKNKKGVVVKKKKSIDETLQARFVQSVSELQHLGFIKPTKRKTDHVQRLTWGGC